MQRTTENLPIVQIYILSRLARAFEQITASKQTTYLRKFTKILKTIENIRHKIQ